MKIGLALVLVSAVTALSACSRTRDFDREDGGSETGGGGGAGGETAGTGGTGTCVGPGCSPVGEDCSEADECGSGFCVDGVCCESACDGSGCEACTKTQTGEDDGVCAPVRAGRNPGDVCDYACDGRGACQVGPGEACATDGACATGNCTAEGTCEICEDGGNGFDVCWAWPYPVGYHLNGVALVSPTEFWAVGEAGTLLHYDEVGGKARWRFSRYEGSPLFKHVCVAGDDVYVASATLVLRGDDDGFTPITGTLTDVADLACTSTGVVWVIDGGVPKRGNGSGTWSTAGSAVTGTAVGLWANGSDVVHVLTQAETTSSASSIRRFDATGAELTEISVPLFDANPTTVTHLGGYGAALVVASVSAPTQDSPTPPTVTRAFRRFQANAWTTGGTIANSAAAPCSTTTVALLGIEEGMLPIWIADDGCYGATSRIRTGMNAAANDTFAHGSLWARAGDSRTFDGESTTILVGDNGQVARRVGNNWVPFGIATPANGFGDTVESVAEVEEGLLFGRGWYHYIGNRSVLSRSWTTTELTVTNTNPVDQTYPLLGAREDDLYRVRVVASSTDSITPSTSVERLPSGSEEWASSVELEDAVRLGFDRGDHLFLVGASGTYDVDLAGDSREVLVFADALADIAAIGGERTAGGEVFLGASAGRLYRLVDGVWEAETILAASTDPVSAISHDDGEFYALVGSEIWQRTDDGWDSIASSIGAAGSWLLPYVDGGTRYQLSVVPDSVIALPFAGDSPGTPLPISLPPATIVRSTALGSDGVLLGSERARILRVRAR